MNCFRANSAKNQGNPHHKPYNNQAGNALFLIFLGIALFAALSFSASQGFRTGASSVSKEQARLLATEIIDYGRTVKDAVRVMQINGCSDTEINFNTPIVTGYNNPSTPSDNSCDVFNNNGGAISYKFPEKVDSAGFWMFTGSACISGVGSQESSNCWTDTVDNEELLIILPRMTSRSICEAINIILLGDDSIATNAGDGDWTEAVKKFKGAYTESNRPDNVPNGAMAYCFKDDDKEEYHYYQVLIAR